MHSRTRFALVLLSLVATSAHAQGLGTNGSPATLPGFPVFQPAVPISAFARAASWFDPSRLNVSTSVSFGSGWNGQGTGLGVTSFSYHFAAPLAMRVSLGQTFGQAALDGGNRPFLEGLDLAYRPHPNFQFQIHYQDVRTPLQLARDPFSRW
jgi:hypothetical protein